MEAPTLLRDLQPGHPLKVQVFFLITGPNPNEHLFELLFCFLPERSHLL